MSAPDFGLPGAWAKLFPAESITTEYEEDAGFVKLFLAEGEIDVVAGTSLTEVPFDLVLHKGRAIRVETCAEIVAKKMWHRGDAAKARDLFDLCAVADAEPAAIVQAAPFLQRHREAFLARIRRRAALMQAEFEAIDALAFSKPFGECVEQAEHILRSGT